jgi:hypothetical protein
MNLINPYALIFDRLGFYRGDLPWPLCMDTWIHGCSIFIGMWHMNSALVNCGINHIEYKPYRV